MADCLRKCFSVTNLPTFEMGGDAKSNWLKVKFIVDSTKEFFQTLAGGDDDLFHDQLNNPCNCLVVIIRVIGLDYS